MKNRNSKKHLSIFLALLCIGCLWGCKSQSEDTAPVGGWIQGEETSSSAAAPETTGAPETTAAPETTQAPETTAAPETTQAASGAVVLCFEQWNTPIRIPLQPLDMSETSDPVEAGADAPVYTYEPGLGETLEAYGETYENNSEKDIFYYEVGSEVRSYTLSFYNPDGSLDSQYENVPYAAGKDSFVCIEAEMEDGSTETYGFWWYWGEGIF